MGHINTNLVLGGFLLVLICQDVVALRAIKKSYWEGLLCAMLPGYLLIYGSREEPRPIKPLIGWLIGASLLLMGLMQ